MRLTTKTDYALIILAALTRQPQRPVSLESIATQTGVSEAYLQRLAARLKSRRLIKAKRGAGGGFFLNKPAGRISVADIVTAVGDSFYTVSCVEKHGKSCRFYQQCSNTTGWDELQQRVSRLFADFSVADIAGHNSKHDSETAPRSGKES